MKCGRCDVGAGVADVDMWALEAAMLGKGAGVRGARTLKRAVWKAMGDDGAGRDSGDMRRRFVRDTGLKRSSSSTGAPSKSVGSSSIDVTRPSG
jgi:hypothetical protein